MVTIRAVGVWVSLLWLGGFGDLVAATHLVTSIDDSGAGSLRAMIGEAAAGDTIRFDGELVGGVISLTGGELFLDKDLQIDASELASGGGLIVSGGMTTRVFRIGTQASVVISGLTIRDGRAPSGEGGGGVSNSGALTLDGCTVTENIAGDQPTQDELPGDGGGIWNSSSGFLVICDSTVSENLAADGGKNDLQDGISGRGGHGGGVYSEGDCHIERSTISGNQAGDNVIAGVGGSGGGIFSNGVLRVVDSLVAMNEAGDGGQSVYPDLGGEGGGIFNAGSCTILRSAVCKNRTGRGAMTIVTGGAGGPGGGIRNTDTLTVTDSMISENVAGNGGPGASGPGGNGGDGGGIYDSGICKLDRVAVVGNIAGESPICCGFGWVRNGRGGGIYSKGSLELINSSILWNRTLPGSLDRPSGEGGGIFTSRSARLTHCTVALNSAIGVEPRPGRGGGIAIDFSAPMQILELRATVVAGNISERGTDVSWRAGSGRFLGRGLSFIGDPSDGEALVGNFISGDPMLAWPTEFNGGSLAMLPLPGSPLIDAGGLQFPYTPPGFDQRRERRVDHDIGAVELTASDLQSELGGIGPLTIALVPSGLELTVRRNSTRPIGVGYSPDLVPGSWIDLGDFIFGVGAVGSFTDSEPGHKERSRGLYRAFLR